MHRRLSVAWFVLALSVSAPAFAKEGAVRGPVAEQSGSRAAVTSERSAVTTEVTPSSKPRVAPRAPAARADAERYAAREAKDGKAKKYRGGDAVVVIGAGTATIILAVILLIILL
jgi:hypothetical protein